VRPLLLAALLVSSACGGSEEARRLEVFAASSLRETFVELEGPRYSFAGSDDLALQIAEGAEADVFAAASPKAPEGLYEDGLVERPRTFATNRLVLIVPRENEAGIQGLADLRQPGVRLVLGDEGVPIGDYTRDALLRAGAEDVLENTVSFEDDVKGVVSKVALDEADAGFVYATDAKAAADDVSVIELPAAIQPEVRYTVAVVAGSDRQDEAKAFVERLLTREGRAALREAGFGLP